MSELDYGNVLYMQAAPYHSTCDLLLVMVSELVIITFTRKLLCMTEGKDTASSISHDKVNNYLTSTNFLKVRQSNQHTLTEFYLPGNP